VTDARFSADGTPNQPAINTMFQTATSAETPTSPSSELNLAGYPLFIRTRWLMLLGLIAGELADRQPGFARSG
jgi:hypothetical protein